MKALRLLLAALATLWPAAALAQAGTVTIQSPNTVNDAGQPRAVGDVFVRNTDGTISEGRGAINPTTAQGVTAATLKVGAGQVRSINPTSGTTAGYILILDAAAAPSSGASTAANKFCLPIAASTGLFIPLPDAIPVTTGAQLLFSTSCSTYTPVVPAAVQLTGQAK